MEAQGRLNKVRAACEAKRDGGCSANLRNTLETANSHTHTHAITGAMMRVSSRYVEYAVRIQREAPELFEKPHAGKVTANHSRAGMPIAFAMHAELDHATKHRP